MGIFQVDQAKCTKCGICSSVCPRSIIDMGTNGLEFFEPDVCIACGQCVAICPQAALDNIRSPLSRQIPITGFPVLDGKTAYYFMRSRRSIRSYKKEAVPRDKLLQLMDIARFAPTGGNSQGLAYVVIENPETLQKITALIINWMEEQMRTDSQWNRPTYPAYVEGYRRTGRDVVLRNAPCFVIATASKDFAGGRVNTHFSFAYVELYATSLGLGSCYAGLFERCAQSACQPLLDVLNLPKDRSITGAIMVGYPKYQYCRLVDRAPLEITFDSLL